MRFHLVPKGHDYFRAFSELAANVEAAAQLLVRFLDDLPDGKSRAREILQHEHIGDKLVHDVVHRLNHTFVTPIDREDIHELVTTMDDVLDHIEAAVDAVVLYRIERPTPQAHRQAEVIADATAWMRKAIDDLEAREQVRNCVIEINRLENDGDRIVRDAIAGLFEDGMECREIIKWKDVYELLETAIDDCEHVANIIEGIVLKHN